MFKFTIPLKKRYELIKPTMMDLMPGIGMELQEPCLSAVAERKMGNKILNSSSKNLIENRKHAKPFYAAKIDYLFRRCRRSDSKF